VSIKIDEALCTTGSILVIYYTPQKCWQFQVISATGQVFGENRIYYTALAAKNAGRSWLGGCLSQEVTLLTRLQNRA